jgi:hypothetical protein
MSLALIKSFHRFRQEVLTRVMVLARPQDAFLILTFVDQPNLPLPIVIYLEWYIQ